MASTKLMETKDGRRYFLISVSRGYGKAPYKKRWYWPMKKDGNPKAKSTVEKELLSVVAEFERACAAGEVLNREQAKEKAAIEAAEAAKLKTVRQYAEGVFMPAKEATLTENSRATYQMFLDRHILPVIGDLLLVDVTPAIIQKLLLNFQKSGKAHATAVKLYNILNGLFGMAFMDDSIPISPMLKVKRPAPRKDEAPTEESAKALTVQELASVLAYVAQEPLKWQAYQPCRRQRCAQRRAVRPPMAGYRLEVRHDHDPAKSAIHSTEGRLYRLPQERETPPRRYRPGHAGTSPTAPGRTGGILHQPMGLYPRRDGRGHASPNTHGVFQFLREALRYPGLSPS